ncbi:unnamed protein product [Allacma fusca]|uniref:GRHL1/CP2 C-terminal domain-containing protein n=1 Tax=Allacma fusca TaxID=39272 RepID=A0A8J2PXF6_9HEXA|nr:unnamed protein product [Allacma fusca]
MHSQTNSVSVTVLGSESSPQSCGSGSGASLSGSNTPAHPPPPPQPAILKFHNTFPPESPPYARSNGCHQATSPPPANTNEKKEGVGLDSNGVSNDSVFGSPSNKRIRLHPNPSDRIMIYVRQDSEDAFTPLHLAPPSTYSLLSALEEKYKISMGSVKNLYRRNGKGIVAKIDDEMLKHYCSEDSFLLEVKPSDNDDAFDVTLTELLDCPQ